MRVLWLPQSEKVFLTNWSVCVFSIPQKPKIAEVPIQYYKSIPLGIQSQRFVIGDRCRSTNFATLLNRFIKFLFYFKFNILNYFILALLSSLK